MWGLLSHPDLVAHFRWVCSEHLRSCLGCGPKALAANVGGTEESVPSIGADVSCGAFPHPRQALHLSGRVPPASYPTPWYSVGLEGHPTPAPPPVQRGPGETPHPCPTPGTAPGLEGHPTPAPPPGTAWAWRDTPTPCPTPWYSTWPGGTPPPPALPPGAALACRDAVDVQAGSMSAQQTLA